MKKEMETVYACVCLVKNKYGNRLVIEKEKENNGMRQTNIHMQRETETGLVSEFDS